MRVNNQVLNNNMMRNLYDSMENMDGLSQQLSSGKKFQYASQDPIGTAHSLQYETMLSGNDQYQKNIDHAEDWLKTTEDALSNSGEILHRARELAIQGASDSNTAEDREAIAAEIEELREEYVNIANNSLGGRHLFSGQKTDEKAFLEADDQEADEVTQYEYNGDFADIKREINPGEEIVINLNGKEVFAEGIDEMDELIGNLEDNDREGIDDNIGNLNDIQDTNNMYRAQVGAQMNRLQLSRNRLEGENINIQELKSKNEDTEIAEVITDLKMQESVYQAALATGARIIQPSLVDFLH